MAVVGHRRNGARRRVDRRVDLFELPVRRAYRPRPGRLRHERHHSIVFIHPGLYRSADPVEWTEYPAPHHASISMRNVIIPALRKIPKTRAAPRRCIFADEPIA